MIIKEIRIKNFRSYYGDDNVFKFSDGLTLILGDNGDGKTTFFEALQWLFNTTLDRGNLVNVSEMKKSKLEVGESDEVSVSMLFDHDGEKFVEKYFSFRRKDERSFIADDVVYRAYETNGAERESTNGKRLIERCFDAFIQRFSMFKGESELDVLDNSTALKELVDKFSDIKKFDQLVENTSAFEDKADTAYTKELKSDDKVSKEAADLTNKIKAIADKIALKKKEFLEKTDSYELYSKKLTQLEQNQETSELFQEIKARLKTQEERATRLRGQINRINFSHSLLDELWVLCAFPPILNEFQKKCAALSKEKRRLEKEFIKQKAATKAKLETIKEIQGALINESTELPWYLPDQETMEEMINERICKVCGRPIEEDSDALRHMIRRLEDYKAHVEMKLRKEQEQKAIEEETLFDNDYVEELHNLSISLSGNREAQVSNIASDIADTMKFVEARSLELKEVEEKIRNINDEKARLLIQAGNVSEALLESQFRDIKGLYDQKNRAEVRLTELNGELKLLKEQEKELQEKLGELTPSKEKIKILGEVRLILTKIANAFKTAKEENLGRFLRDLEEQANEYLAHLSANDFHGEIRLRQTADESTEIHLYSSNGTEIKKPSGSQRTVMYISVLFAISDFTQQKREEDYPLIFDAATSSFGDSKEGEFYNVISNVKKQCIIVTKDFISKGKVRHEDIQQLECPVYRIQKASGFDSNNMATIRTIVEKIK